MVTDYGVNEGALINNRQASEKKLVTISIWQTTCLLTLKLVLVLQSLSALETLAGPGRSRARRIPTQQSLLCKYSLPTPFTHAIFFIFYVVNTGSLCLSWGRG